LEDQLQINKDITDHNEMLEQQLDTLKENEYTLKKLNNDIVNAIEDEREANNEDISIVKKKMTS